MITEDNRRIIAVENLAVMLQQQLVLRDIHFQAAAGEFIGVIGANGAGKSTLLRSLRGLIPASAGQVAVFGRPVNQMSENEKARHMAYMQQEVRIGFDYTVLELVLTGRYPYLSWWQNEGSEDYRIARKYLEFTGVGALADKKVTQVSGGERQRILLAKVLAQETPVVFLDEPTASLDLGYQEEIFRYCRAICREGKTVLMVVHDIKTAAKYCSRLLLMAGGRVVADGTPAAVVTPEHLSTAFGVHSAVYLNKITDCLDIHIYRGMEDAGKRGTIHVIGGGGTGGTFIRVLSENGYQVSCGVLQEGDTDTETARAFCATAIVGQSFRVIDEIADRENQAKIMEAECTVLANICYGKENMANLQAAFLAKKLIVIEDTSVQERDFTGGAATKLYEQLVMMPQVTVMTAIQCLDKISMREGSFT
ncbi:hypothetical protein P22_0721 [Propionispora sp. 2/2-37]|uniref:ABC transporter ATP-binding protein n=1 Tax=Propionispora sp. 2/2-37 TaxID=1677858 RepID=UPI0006C1112A|nr:ABC transporter ATP-binding protein [Propionispora sp. 2/2-37]CUH94655.1 hypothetical protein P22_0721 [Propionispora sp. 2/2-37]